MWQWKNRKINNTNKFKKRWGKDLPSAVKCLEKSIDACLTFFNCPEEEWISLRTTNIIEHLNKEFKRRTKPMEIVAGENACYALLSFICIKMELHWRSNPLGKVRNNLPYFKKLPFENFTQKTWHYRSFSNGISSFSLVVLLSWPVFRGAHRLSDHSLGIRPDLTLVSRMVKKNFYLFSMLFHPVPDSIAVVHFKIVENQEYFPIGILD